MEDRSLQWFSFMIGCKKKDERNIDTMVTEIMPNPLFVDTKSVFIRPFCAVALWETEFKWEVEKLESVYKALDDFSMY